MDKMQRISHPILNQLIGEEFPVGPHGSITLVDYMGDDTSIVQAARTSIGKGVKTVRQDRSLIRYLFRKRHTTPFEMCEIKLRIKCPMSVWRQWIRQRTASVNEYSTRYSEAIDEISFTDPSEWRTQAKNIKQGSDGFVGHIMGQKLSQSQKELHEAMRKHYKMCLQHDVARELARDDLPLGNYTLAYWKIDLLNLLKFLGQRMDSHAQKEIRDFATVIGEKIVARWVPLTWDAFQDYQVQGISLSRHEVDLIRFMVTDDPDGYLDYMVLIDWHDSNGKPKKRCRELREFEEKLDLMGFSDLFR